MYHGEKNWTLNACRRGDWPDTGQRRMTRRPSSVAEAEVSGSSGGCWGSFGSSGSSGSNGSHGGRFFRHRHGDSCGSHGGSGVGSCESNSCGETSSCDCGIQLHDDSDHEKQRPTAMIAVNDTKLDITAKRELIRISRCQLQNIGNAAAITIVQARDRETNRGKQVQV